MIEELFSIGSFSISPFGVMLVASLFAAFWQLRKAMQHYGIGNEEDASSVIFWVGFCGIAGGKIYYAILNGDAGLILDRAGIVWYGAFTGGFLALLGTIRWRGLPLAGSFDATAPGLALGYGIGRIGCFLVGDDYGVPTSLPWGMKFKVGLPRTTAENLRSSFGVDTPPELIDAEGWVPVHPTQLYESAAGFIIWGIVLVLLRRGIPFARLRRDVAPGNLFLTAVGLLVVERFLVEFVRAKDDRFFGDYTLAQAISVAILLACAVAAWRNRVRHRREASP